MSGLLNKSAIKNRKNKYCIIGDTIGNNPIPSKRRTIQPTLSCSDNHLTSSDSCTSIHLSTFNRQPSLKSNPATRPTQDENEYDDIDSNTDTITHDHRQTSNRESQEDEMQQIVNYINYFENSLSAPHPKSLDPNTTLIQSMIDDEEPCKLRLSSSSLSSSADSLVDEAPKIHRRTYLVNKLYDNLANNDQSFDDAHYQKVIIGKETDSDYDNDLLVNCQDTNVMYVSATNNKAHIYHSPIEIRDSTGFEVQAVIEHNNNTSGQTNEEAVYENLDFDNQLVELKNQIKQLLSESAECEQEIKQQITRTKSADNEVVKRAPSLCKSASDERIGRAAADQGQAELNSVKSKIKLMEAIVGSKLVKSERSSSTGSSCSSSRSPPVSPVLTLANEHKATETSEKRKTVKELLSKFEQSSHKK
ncbi:hypothetical protein BpHYR1_035363 [Brachionus plicatilis]|uniref:Uncharacterized protein n=1 Tax=Brachionus plicatilis TaxID=10195 RepID=A0A3M7S8F8_BRAPC|nr:hypothetical protein BpHYR1_035363 [Brachionus plicatilis]